MQSNIILYTTDSGSVSVQVQYEDGTFWLTQKRRAELFGVEVPTINYHLKEVFKTGELNEDSVIRKIRITADDGKNYLTNCYHLKAILAVGYRVNSSEATAFRRCVTNTLDESRCIHYPSQHHWQYCEVELTAHDKSMNK